MADALFEKGRESFLDGTVDWDTDTIKDILMDTGTVDTGVKAVTAASNATPIVVTTGTAHGFTTGDIVVVNDVGGNLAANGVWKITAASGSVFSLTDPVTDGNVVGSAAYTSGGYTVCLGPSAAGDHIDDFDGCRVGTDQTLGTKTVTAGVADAADVTHTAVTGNSVEAVSVYEDTGTPSTSRMIAFLDGKQIVTCAAQAAISAVTIAVERLLAGIPNGTVLTFSNGATATLSALANAGDRTVTVSALAAAVTPGSRALAPKTASGLPVTPNGGNIVVSWPTAGIFKL